MFWYASSDFVNSGEKLKLPARSNSFRSEKSSTSSAGDSEKKPLADTKSPKPSKKHTVLKVFLKLEKQCLEKN